MEEGYGLPINTKKVYDPYDLVIAHESNEYFKVLKNGYKFPQLEIIYYKALNAEIKDNTNRATSYLASFLVKTKSCMS
ncbi:hypothetical protein [Granulicatella adiacens]|uniref:hypothetical protein n=1 Tax=Granulicatella adiacens TaxID=46124 RepID=UPI00195912B6|nr:hypothetical protein [Granulicatella adiacens]